MDIDRDEDSDEPAERVEWVVETSLRGHHADVFDLCWSKNGDYIVSGSVDNVVMVWDVAKGRAIQEFCNHEKYVRGVSWDPLGEYIVSLGCDRTLHIHPLIAKEKRLRKNKTKKVVQKSVSMKKVQVKDNGISTMTFHDDNVAIYFSRLRFSPDGNFLFVPSGKSTPSRLNLNDFFQSRFQVIIPK
jgi:chromatin assembly factor 1 subunit B